MPLVKVEKGYKLPILTRLPPEREREREPNQNKKLGGGFFLKYHFTILGRATTVRLFCSKATQVQLT